jgi:TetR/AcrR family transcriptional regulator, transcriptional repressor of aconitase
MGNMPRVSRRYRDARRHQILRAARRCFARNGFQATSMQDILTEAGLSAGSVYSHFTGKDAIVTAITEEVTEEITAFLDVVSAGEEPPGPDEVLGHMLSMLERADVAALAVAVWAEAARNPVLGKRLSARYGQMRNQLAALVRLYQDRGTIDPGVPADDIAQILTALGPAFLSQLALGTGIDAAAFTRGLHALLHTSNCISR